MRMDKLTDKFQLALADGNRWPWAATIRSRAALLFAPSSSRAGACGPWLAKAGATCKLRSDLMVAAHGQRLRIRKRQPGICSSACPSA